MKLVRKEFQIHEKPTDGGGTFTGYASVYNVPDRVGDIVHAGAFEKSLDDRLTFPLLFNHDKDRIIGKAEITSDSKGLFVEGQLNMDDPQAKNLATLMNMGAVDAMSVGFIPKNLTPIIADQRVKGFNINEALLLEASIVTVGCHQDAKCAMTKDFYIEDAPVGNNEPNEVDVLRAENLALQKQLLKSKYTRGN